MYTASTGQNPYTLFMMKQNKLSCMFYFYEWVEDWTGTACIKTSGLMRRRLVSFEPKKDDDVSIFLLLVNNVINKSS